MLGNGVHVLNISAVDAVTLILDHKIQDFEMYNLRTVVGC